MVDSHLGKVRLIVALLVESYDQAHVVLLKVRNVVRGSKSTVAFFGDISPVLRAGKGKEPFPYNPIQVSILSAGEERRVSGTSHAS